MPNHRRNAGQAKWASEQLSIARKQARRRNAIPATKQAQRELAAQAAAEQPITRFVPAEHQDPGFRQRWTFK